MNAQYRGTYSKRGAQEVLGDTAVCLFDSSKDDPVTHKDCVEELQRRDLADYYIYVHCPSAGLGDLELFVHFTDWEVFNGFMLRCDFALGWDYMVWAVAADIHQKMNGLPAFY